jgi:hypothetical protein
MITLLDLTMPSVHDDVATVEYHRGPPLPVRPSLLAPEPRFSSPRPGPPQLPRPSAACPTCPFRQVVNHPPMLPDGTPARLPEPTAAPSRPATTTPQAVASARLPEPTATQLRPIGGTGSTTVLQAVAPAPPRPRPPPPPPPRAWLAHLQLALWLVIAAGLLILAFRPLAP